MWEICLILFATARAGREQQLTIFALDVSQFFNEDAFIDYCSKILQQEHVCVCFVYSSHEYMA